MSKKSKFTGRRKGGYEKKMEDLEKTEPSNDGQQNDSGDQEVAPTDLATGATGTGASGSDADDGADEEVRKSSSVVAAKFKDRYLANARKHGIKGKAARRSNWDWLAQIIARECLTKDKLNIERFKALMDANGVDHSKWNNESRGWEGRFRMTGRVALQRIVADRGVLYLPEGTAEQAPADFVEKYKTKA